MTTPSAMELRFLPASHADIEDLVALRIAAMQDSLQRLGRFDPVRARERFLATFVPQQGRHILLRDQRVGLVSLLPQTDHLQLAHLYLHPYYQGQGIGAAVLQYLFAEADTLGMPIHVGALRDSPANRFYQHHGFQFVCEEEWDIYYQRPPTVTTT